MNILFSHFLIIILSDSWITTIAPPHKVKAARRLLLTVHFTDNFCGCLYDSAFVLFLSSIHARISWYTFWRSTSFKISCRSPSYRWIDTSLIPRKRQTDWICKGSDRRCHDVLSDGFRYRRKVPQSGIRNHFDGSDHEREWAPVWNAAYKRCKSLLWKIWLPCNRRYKENRRNIYGKTVQLKLAARFFYRSSRLISRGVSICFNVIS